MFQSVIDSQEWRTRRLGTGAGVSVLVHVGLVAAVLVISAGVAKPPPPETRELVFIPPAPRGTPNAVSAPTVKPAAEPPKPKTSQRRRLVQPTDVHPLPPAPPTPEVADDTPQTPGVPDGEDDAPPCVSCTALTGKVTPTNVVPEPTGEETEFSYGTMTPPALRSGSPIQYTREALEAHVSGQLIAKCVITREGDVDKCRIIKGLPHMNEAVLAALETRRYTPVTYMGRPIAVSYVFNVKLDLPR